MKKNCFKLFAFTLIIGGILCAFSCSTTKKINAPKVPGIEITFTGEEVADTVFVSVAPIPTDTSLYFLDYFNATDQGVRRAYPVKDRKVFILPEEVPSVYKIHCDYYSFPSVEMRKTEHVDMQVSRLSPSRYTIEHSAFPNPIPYSDEFYQLKRKLWKLSRYKLTDQEFDSLSVEMRLLIDKMMKESDLENSTRIITQLEDDFAPYAFGKLPEGAENTLNYMCARALRNTGVRDATQGKKLEEALATQAPTPSFSLPNADGTEFNLTSLRGKWVVLDFWTTWCGPCKRGFEQMKKLYQDHSPELEVVAIACGDQEETWRNTIAELELPWINLLAPAPESHDGTVAGYPINAYPTEIIIDPEGNLRDYTIGEDESFYERLVKMMSNN